MLESYYTKKGPDYKCLEIYIIELECLHRINTLAAGLMLLSP